MRHYLQKTAMRASDDERRINYEWPYQYYLKQTGLSSRIIYLYHAHKRQIVII